MNKDEIINQLENHKIRLLNEVVDAYRNRGDTFGTERFNAWRRKLTEFLSEYLPNQVAVLNKKLTHYAYSMNYMDSPLQHFWKTDGERMESFLDSLILDIRNNEFDFSQKTVAETRPNKEMRRDLTKVFIVHGHDNESKEKTARFIEKIGFTAIILSEQPNQGRTIIEKIEEFSNVGFGIVLYTPDDKGNTAVEADEGKLNPRARQNVVFEHGFLMGKIGRKNVVTLVTKSVEIPTDISGVVFLSDKDWQLSIAKEMKSAGYTIDFNKLV